MRDPEFMRPHALSKAPIVRESRLIRDLTMPERDWSKYDKPPRDRGFVSERAPRVRTLNVPTIVRQAG